MGIPNTLHIVVAQMLMWLMLQFRLLSVFGVSLPHLTLPTLWQRMALLWPHQMQRKVLWSFIAALFWTLNFRVHTYPHMVTCIYMSVSVCKFVCLFIFKSLQYTLFIAVREIFILPTCIQTLHIALMHCYIKIWHITIVKYVKCPV